MLFSKNIYWDGRGVTQNYVQAHKWFNISAANGYDFGREARESVEEKMIPAQIAKAQRLAQEWMEKHGRK